MIQVLHQILLFFFLFFFFGFPGLEIINHDLRIERSVSVCFFNIAILPISFSNAKWIWMSLESLMIEFYLHIKIHLDYFQEG